MKVTPQLIKVFFVCPFNVMIVVPGLILWFSKQTGFLATTYAGFNLYLGIPGALLIAAGLVTAYSCVSLITDHGDGTPAPWNPPKILVVRGIYRHVRNPMIGGVFLVLLGESLICVSLPLFLWFLFFLVVNLLYIPLIEEPGLLHRFGDPYQLYLQNVPRWIPKRNPWEGSSEVNQKLTD